MSYNHKLVSAVQDNEIDLNQADWTMYPELAAFTREVKRTLRMGDLRVANPPGAATYCYIYRPQDKYSMGRLQYDGEKYGVYSRTIENKRYNNYNPDHYTKSSKDMNKAVKHTLAYLRPYKPVEVANRRGRELDKFISSVPEQLREAKQNLIRDLTANYNRLATDTFEAELRHLVQSGYRFMNPEIGEKLTKYFEVKPAHEEAVQRDHDMVYLRV